MKRIAAISMCFMSIVLVVSLSTSDADVQEPNFNVEYIHDYWFWDYFKTLNFTTAAISFDRKGHLYTADLFNDLRPEEKIY